MSDYEISTGGGTSKHTFVLYGLIVALIGAMGYLFMQLNQTKAELVTNRDQILDEVAKVRESSAVSTQTSRRNAEQLKAELDASRAQASQLVGQAKVDAEKRSEQIAANLDRVQRETNKQVNAITGEVNQVKESATAANTKITEVTADVGNVKTDVAATKSELEKTIAQLKSTQGDMGLQSGLIATNSKELQALKELGQRNYFEFTLAKAKAPQKIGDISVLLKKADPKSNRYTIEVIADDKRVEKKDKTLNEPVQFILSRATQPYELVVNDVKKDLIKGYLAAPKVQTTRN